MGDNRSLQIRLKQFISDSCTTEKCAAEDIWFSLLSYRSLLSRNEVAVSISKGQSGKEVAVVQERLLNNVMVVPLTGHVVVGDLFGCGVFANGQR